MIPPLIPITWVAYNSVFIGLTVSAFGMSGALYLGSVASSSMIENALQLFKMLGTGVIAATAWTHFLPDAFSQFSKSMPTRVLE